MTEGGYDEFENPAFDKDYEEGNVDDADLETSRDSAEQQMYGTSVRRNTKRYKRKVLKGKKDNFISYKVMKYRELLMK